MGRGYRKRSKTFFKKGHKRIFPKGTKECSGTDDTGNAQYVRLTSEEQSLVDDNPIQSASYAGEGGSDKQGPAFKFLRPRKAATSTPSVTQQRCEIQRLDNLHTVISFKHQNIHIYYSLTDMQYHKRQK